MTGKPDNVDNPGRSRSVTITHKAGAEVTGDTLPVTVLDDDADRGLKFTQADKNLTRIEIEGQEIYQVELNSEPSGEITVYVISNEPGVATVDQGPLTFGAGDWNVKKDVTVRTGADFGKPGGRKTVSIIHTPVGGHYSAVDAEELPVTGGQEDP